MIRTALFIIFTATLLLPALAWGIPEHPWCEVGWTALHEAPLELTNGAAAYYNGRVYVVGGETWDGDSVGYNHKVRIYDLAEDTWETSQAYVVGVGGATSLCAVAYDWKIYQFGGYPWTDRTVIYNIHDDTMSLGEPCPYEFMEAQCALIGDKVYFAGGWGPGETGLRRTMAYDIPNDTWITGLAKMPDEGKAGGLGVGYGGLFYNVAGFVPWTIPDEDKLYIYDTVQDTWETKDSPYEGRGRPGGGLIYDRIYIHAGSFSFISYTDTAIYDITDDTWSANDLDMPWVRVGTASTVVPGGSTINVGGEYDPSDVLYSDKNQMFSLCLSWLEAVDPNSVYVDHPTEITINGAGFEQNDFAYLYCAKSEHDLLDLTVVDAYTMTGTVPGDLPVGVYDLVVQSESGESFTLEDAFEVVGGDGDDDADDDDDDDDDDGCCG